MAVTLGSNGVLEANLIIPQSTTFACARKFIFYTSFNGKACCLP